MNDKPKLIKMEQLKRVVLRGIETSDIEDLSGFDRESSHFIPKDISEATRHFVARIAQEDLSEDLEEKHERIKNAFRLKEKNIEDDDLEEGGRFITTPYFDYIVSVQINPDDFSEVLWHYEIDSISKPDAVFSTEFEEAFGNIFTILEFQPKTPFDIKDIVDQIEEMNDKRLTVKTGKKYAFCEIQIVGLDVKIKITSKSFKIEQESGKSTKDLIKGFFKAQRILINECKLKRLTFSEHET